MKSGGQIPWNVMAMCEMSKTSWQTGKLRMNEDFGNLSKDQYQFGKKVLPGMFKGYAEIAGGIWKGDILIADNEELEKLNASDIHPRRLNAKDVLVTHKDGEFVFLVADSSAKLSGRDDEFQEPTVRLESTVRRESQRGISRRQGKVST